MRSDASSDATAAGAVSAADVTLASDPASARRLRRRSVANLLRMGHCAPTIMKTAIDDAGLDAPWLVRLLAGMPGGIANTGAECGGVTAPLVLLGLKHRDEVDAHGVPVVVTRGRAMLQGFADAERTTSCAAIRGEARVPLRCIGVIREAPVRAAQSLAAPAADAAPTARLDGHVRLFAFWRAEDFHCAHAVLRRLAPEIEVTDDLLAATSGFVGGTAMAGMTCSAVSGGVMALGLALGEIENSRARVLRMIATMAVAGDAFADDMNAFNRVMNLGHRLAGECIAEFGSIQCRCITGCGLGSDDGARRYIEQHTIDRCREIVRFVADKVHRRISGTGSLAVASASGLPAPAIEGIR